MNARTLPALAAALGVALAGASALAQGTATDGVDSTDARRTSERNGQTDDWARTARDAREEQAQRERDAPKRAAPPRDTTPRDTTPRDTTPRDTAARDAAPRDGAREASPRDTNSRDTAARGASDRPEDVRDGLPADAASRDFAPPGAAVEPAEASGASSSNGTRSWLARDSRAPVGAPLAESGSSNTGLTLGAVLLVLGLAAAAIVIRYKKRQALPITPSESRLTVLSSSRVGPKAFAVTAHVNGRVLLLGVTDHTVTHLGWLDGREAAAPVLQEPEAEAAETEQEDDLPEDYPGSALRASKAPAAFASSSRLERFQEVLRGAEEARVDLPMRPSYAAGSMDAASLLAAQTTDIVVAASAPALAPAAVPMSLRRKRRSRDSRESIAPRDSRPAAPSRAPKAVDPSLEGQVAGLRALRNGG